MAENLPPITINPNRLEIDEVYLQMAEVMARRSKANRLQVGAVIVNGTQLVSDGYNGMPAGWHDDVCEVWDENGKMQTKPELLHAEANALTKIARDGFGRAEGATLYTTDSPCPECAKLAKQCGIKRVVFRREYRLTAGLDMLRALGISVEQLNHPTT
jgi:dCMP deaminase